MHKDHVHVLPPRPQARPRQSQRASRRRSLSNGGDNPSPEKSKARKGRARSMSDGGGMDVGHMFASPPQPYGDAYPATVDDEHLLGDTTPKHKRKTGGFSSAQATRTSVGAEVAAGLTVGPLVPPPTVPEKDKISNGQVLRTILALATTFDGLLRNAPGTITPGHPTRKKKKKHSTPVAVANTVNNLRVSSPVSYISFPRACLNS